MQKRFKIEKQEWIWHEECEHPLCERFHKAGCPTPKRVEYVIVEMATGEKAGWSYAYRLHREAKAELEKFLATEKEKA